MKEKVLVDLEVEQGPIEIEDIFIWNKVLEIEILKSVKLRVWGSIEGGLRIFKLTDIRLADAVVAD